MAVLKQVFSDYFSSFSGMLRQRHLWNIILKSEAILKIEILSNYCLRREGE
jgi:hypothetical protein